MSEPAFVAETLAWCNAFRKEKGLEPLERLPKGIRGEADSCPCGKASGVLVGWDNYSPVTPWDGRKERKQPDFVHDFVVAFDRQKLPQYDEELP